MSIRKTIPVLVCSLLAANAWADDPLKVDPTQLGAHKTFGPPAPVPPPKIMSYIPENQFDPFLPGRVHATDSVDDSMRPGHFMIGRRGPHTYGGAFWRQRGANFYLIGGLHYTKADAYKDGGGDKVDFGYRRDGEAVVLGWVPGAPAEFRLTLLRDNIADDKQPQHLMDPVSTRRLIGKFDARVGKPDDSNTIHFTAARIDLKREANNYGARHKPSDMPGVKVKVDRQITNFDLNYGLDFMKSQRVLVGVRYQIDKQNGRRFIVTPNGPVLNGFRVPDVRSSRLGAYAGYRFRFAEHHDIELAGSWDRLVADPKEAGHDFAPLAFPGPRMLWMKYYGQAQKGKTTDSGFSGLVRYTWRNDASKFFAEGASLLRMPDNTERFGALFGPDGKGLVNNPGIKPERHGKITIGGDVKGPAYRDYQSTMNDDFARAWNIEGEIFYDKVGDFITYDRARKQAGVKIADGTTITRNVDATLAGADLRWRHNWTQGISTSLGLGWQYGQNETDKRPIYQVRPFHADFAIDHKSYFSKGSWSVGAAIRYEGEQTRRDDDPKTGLGIDLAEAAKSHVVADIYGSIQFRNRFGLNFGVDNVLNRKYASFIANYHVQSLSPRLIYAPGRTYWLNVHANF